MHFKPVRLKGACIVEPELLSDVRGFFARTYCEREFAAQGLRSVSVQCNVSFNKARGTIRGMHFQRVPNAEAKLVRCAAGSIFDVIVDLRRGSPTYGQWQGFELTAQNRLALYIPEGFAHGFQTLADDTEVFYQMFDFFAPESAGGLRWNDRAFQIDWPLANPIMSDKDRSYPDFDGFSL